MNFEQGWACFALGLTACLGLTSLAAAQCGGADVYEDNDDCANAVVLAPGTYTGLTCQGPGDPGGDDRDFYKVTVGAGDLLDVTVLHTWSVTEDIDAYLYDASNPLCGDKLSFLDDGYTSDDNEVMAWANTTGASVDVVIEVSAWLGGSTAVICDDYDLVISVGPDPCQAGLDDSFEENDSCGAAVVLPAGSTTGLFVSTFDEDFYKVTVPAANQILIDQTYGGAGDMGFDVYDDPGCTNFVAGASWGAGLNQDIWSNGTGAAVDVYIRTYMVDGDCLNYDMSVTIQPDPCQAVGVDDSFEDNDDCASAVSITAGTTLGLFVSTVDEDYYKISLAAGDQLTVDQFYNSLNAELEIGIYDDPACTNQVSVAGWGAGNNQAQASNSSGAAADFFIRASVVDGDCNNYDLTLTVQPDPCLAPGLDDSFEDNDFCGSGVALPAGLHTGLFIAESDLDYYEITIPAGDQVTVTQTYNPAVELYIDLHDDPSCTTFVAGAGWNGGSNSFTYANSTGAPQTVYLECNIDDFTGNCTNYDLDVSFSPDPCQQPGNDDGLEDNDDCASAYTIGSQIYPGLFVSKGDQDVYTFQLVDGGMADISVNHIALNGDIDVFLYDDTPGTCLDGFSFLTSAETGLDNEIITWSNTTGSTVTYYLQVEVWSGSASDCNNYDLVATLVGNQISTPTCQGDGTFDAGSGPVGCPCGNNSALGAEEGCANSQGHGATIAATGSNSVASDNMVFSVDQARPNQPSLLVQGTSLIAVPFKDGVLCMGNPTERVEVVFLDASGSGSTTASIVTEGNVSVGDTRYYQFWYRDPSISVCGTGSSFSAGLCVVWM